MTEEEGGPGSLWFQRITVKDWRQFDSISVNFHPRLTVLTGANASGKSTLLALLARHFNWSRGYSSSPVRVKRGNEWRVAGRRRSKRILESTPWIPIGRLHYGSGAATDISVPGTLDPNVRMQYELTLSQQQTVPGLFISSHRLASGNYTPVPNIPTTFANSEAYYEQFASEVRTRWAGGWSGRPPQMAMKETLIAAAVFGSRDNEAVEFNEEAHEIWNGFQRILRILMPRTVGFRDLRVRVPDIIVRTSTDDFILDEASGGMSAIMEMAWQIFLRSRVTPDMAVVMDEPENHLHPSLQRELLPNLLLAFPRAQFIVATHSPFVVTARRDSHVYVLDYNEVRRVYSRQLDYVNKAASADETLQRVLGLTSTYPSWAEGEFESILNRYMTGSMTTEQMRELRQALSNAGLGAEFPEALVRLSDSAPDQA
jgi:predicted ATPase